MGLRLVHVTRHFADQVLKKFFFELDRFEWVTRCSFLRWLRIWYLFCIKIRFWYRKPGFKVFKNRILDFFIKKFLQQMPRDIPLDAELNSLQNGLFSFDFRSLEQIGDSYTIPNFLLSLWALRSMYQSHFCIGDYLHRKQ